MLPFLGTAGSAISRMDNRLILINGEIKPGLRTAAVWQGLMQGNVLEWQPQPDLIGAETGSAQEGLAGAFSGISHKTVLVAGGANFPGAWKQFNRGHLYAHQGLENSGTSRCMRWSIISGESPGSCLNRWVMASLFRGQIRSF